VVLVPGDNPENKLPTEQQAGAAAASFGPKRNELENSSSIPSEFRNESALVVFAYVLTHTKDTFISPKTATKDTITHLNRYPQRAYNVTVAAASRFCTARKTLP